MHIVVKFVARSITGFFVGISVLLVGIVALIAYAFVTGAEVYLPGVIKAWFTRENDMPALNFEPNGIGMVIAIISLALLYVCSTFQQSRRTTNSGASRMRN
ncbi:hypothetical protein [Rathayibacter toxicus]|uniref:Uncharacterized protein n=1 Tax=Rathayibacter toxicus TaxID=145458 RepID=A0A2S5Y565_9MICO|nr:hypothetical protein [Rathayibacter toxicus]PPH21732.1 hypothetical protein C5D17_09320 [Rathayibacter toxicus]PPH56162.1 hypothetical protein C5D30_09310 [Rathayibacter toxicus]PPH58257.1 hypothetical protein C5C93_09360 [Rathayibacter toxicus]PPH86004.1 hypothetical protein C5D31_09340 [Rathayibacter toxicus]PPI13887.1 hypothetical protein C5C51_09285 [Rathayibacter toxicus]